MRKISILILSAFISASAVAQKHFAPVNANATPEAKELLESLYTSRDAGKILSGLHHNMLGMPQYTEDLNRIRQNSDGKVPLIWGGDVAWDADKVVELATQHWSEGFVVTLMWHAARPFDKGHVDFKNQTQGKFTAQQWKELVTEGSEMHRMWLNQVDSISEYLKVLQERHIPVIWRPYHEMNGEWFWWGDRRGADGFVKLWRMLYDRMTNYHHLDNLIWVWNANAPRKVPTDPVMAYDLYYPGADYVDVLATDVYHDDWQLEHHDQLDKLSDGKLIALGECGPLPTPEVLRRMNRFAWFMIWTTFTRQEYNSPKDIRDIFEMSEVVSR